MKTSTFVIVLMLILGGAFVLSRGGETTVSSGTQVASNVTMVDGVQIVTITAQGGYEPAISVLDAGIPTTIRFVTDGTFDCSSVVRIPALKVSKTLPSNGSTDISVGSLEPGTIQGTCGMGMYQFTLEVQD